MVFSSPTFVGTLGDTDRGSDVFAIVSITGVKVPTAALEKSALVWKDVIRIFFGRPTGHRLCVAPKVCLKDFSD